MRRNDGVFWFPFNADRWLMSDKLGQCSMTARGVLSNILCRLYKSPRPGYAVVDDSDGKLIKISQENLLNWANIPDQKANRKALAELFTWGVLRVEDGVTYSRMAAEEGADIIERTGDLSQKRRAAANRRWHPGDDANADASAYAKLDAKGIQMQCTETETVKETVLKDSKERPDSPEGTPVGKPTHEPSEEVRAVFDHWRQLWPSAAKLTPGRRQKIERAIQEVGLDGALHSLDGWSLDDWPERHTSLKAFDLEVLFRSAEKVERGLDLYQNPPAAKPRAGAYTLKFRG